MRYTFLLSSVLALGAVSQGHALETENLVQEESILKTAPLKEVTVFPNQARIERTWTKALKAGRQQITLEGLEYGMASRSVQVLSATSGVRVELVEIENAHLKNVLSEKAKELRVMIDREEASIMKMRDDMAALSANEALLRGLEIGRNPEGHPNNFEATPLDTEAWSSVLDDIAKQEKIVRAELRKIERQLDKRQVEMQVLLDRIRRLQAYEVMAKKNLTLTVNADRAGEATFDLGYQVHGPGWFPHYQSRVNKDRGNVELTGYAVVFQGTGRDWQNVPVNVSTANPDAGASIPDLQAWYLREQFNPHLEGLRGRAHFKANKKKDSKGFVAGEYKAMDALNSLEEEQAEWSSNARRLDRSTLEGRNEELKKYAELQDKRVRRQAENLARNGYFSEKAGKASNATSRRSNVTSQISQNTRLYAQLREQLKHIRARQKAPQTNRPHQYAGSRVQLPVSRGSWYDQEFRALTPGTIPSTSEPVRVLLAQHGFDTKFHYLVRPRESDRAYLLSEASNKSGKAWLPGGMRVFFDNDFVGKSSFNGLGEKGIFRLSLGVDENIKVKRTTKVLESDKGVFSDDKKRTIEVTIEIKNMNLQSEEIRIEERLPQTNQKETEVKLLDDGADQHDELSRDENIKDRLRWTLKLGAGKTQTFTWTYSISHDDSLKLQGFQP